MNSRNQSSRNGAPSQRREPSLTEAQSGTCTAVLGSVTAAMQAQRVLANAAIYVTVTKVSSGTASQGCVYGIVFPCAQQENVRIVLKRADISIKKMLGG